MYLYFILAQALTGPQNGKIIPQISIFLSPSKRSLACQNLAIKPNFSVLVLIVLAHFGRPLHLKSL
jgi:hypothetical protein